MKLFKFLFVFSLLFLMANVIFAQGEDIDFVTSTYENIHLWLIGVVTYIWGQLTKLVPKLKDMPLPTAVKVAAGGLAIVIMVLFQGVGSLVPNLMAVLSTMGVYDLLASFGKKNV
jgi:hypothetical protein